MRFIKTSVALIKQVTVIILFVQLALISLRWLSSQEHPYAESLSLWTIFEDQNLRRDGGIYQISRSIVVTISHAFAVVLIACCSGLIFGLLVNKLPTIKNVVMPIFDFFRGIPATIIYPIASIVFSSKTEAFLIGIAAIPCSTIMTFAIIKALEKIDPDKVNIFKINSEESNIFRVYMNYKLPVMMPDIYDGLSITASYALVICCVLEMLGLGPAGSAGGLIALDADNNGGHLTGEALALIILVGLVSFVLNFTTSRINEDAQSHRF